MRILILGGTRFLGRGLVDAALERNHSVTLFHRGKTNPDVYPELEHLHGDRDTDLDALRGKTWDVVIDTSGYIPRHVRQSAALLADVVQRYIFISTISVYSDLSHPGTHEASPLRTLSDPSVETVTGETYGGLKVLCEQAAEDAMPGRTLNVRSGLIVGPNDPTDRFTYWVVKAARQQHMIAPESPQYAMQFIDVRDIAEWCVLMAELKQTGTYNVTGRQTPLSEVIGTAAAISGNNPVVHWLDAPYLLAQGIQPWSDLPLWMPSTDPEMAGTHQIRIDPALAHGLTFRPLHVTVTDTLAWRDDSPLSTGLAPEREAEILKTRY